MKFGKRIHFISLLVGIIFITEHKCAPTQNGEEDTIISASNDTDSQLDALPNDEILSCVLQVISDKSISDMCKQFFSSFDEGDSEKPSSTPGIDLQNELQGLSGQIRSTESNFDAVEDALDDVKRTEQSENTSDDDDDQPIDVPFMTSFKDSGDEYIVIPVKYLKDEIGFDLRQDTSKDINNNGVNDKEFTIFDPQITEDDTAITKENSPDETDLEPNDKEKVTEVEEALWTPNKMNKDTSPDVDQLHQVELDIIQLGEDLKTLEEKEE